MTKNYALVESDSRPLHPHCQAHPTSTISVDYDVRGADDRPATPERTSSPPPGDCSQRGYHGTSMRPGPELGHSAVPVLASPPKRTCSSRSWRKGRGSSESAEAAQRRRHRGAAEAHAGHVDVVVDNSTRSRPLNEARSTEAIGPNPPPATRTRRSSAMPSVRASRRIAPLADRPQDGRHLRAVHPQRPERWYDPSADGREGAVETIWLFEPGLMEDIHRPTPLPSDDTSRGSPIRRVQTPDR